MMVTTIPSLAPLHDTVFVRPLPEAERATDAGVIVLAATEQRARAMRAEVVAVGPGERILQGELAGDGWRVPPAVEPGDVVLISRGSGHEVRVEGEALRVVREFEVLAVLQPAGAADDA